MMTTYGIIGAGPTKKNIIEDLLNELGEDNDYLLYGSHRLSDSETRVLDWMVNHEMSYTVVADPDTSENLLEDAYHTVSCKNLTDEFFLKELKKRKGVLLMLWDEERDKEMTRIVYIAADLGLEIKDLTNGLVPIVLEDAPANTPQRVETDEVEIEQFSREELEGMPISVLRKNAKSQNIDTDGLSKKQLIDQLVGIEDTPVVEPETPKDVAQHVAMSRQTLQVDGECMVIVVMPNGTVVSTPATTAEVRTILGLG